MTFGAPAFLLLIALAPLAGIALAHWLAWRRAARQRFGGIAPEAPLVRAALFLSPVLLLGAVALAAIAAARPQFGHQETLVEERGIDLAIVLDLSTSMLSTDAQPSRLARAQEEIDALLEERQGDRVGLVVFARKPLLRSPLTTDLSALRGLVRGVDKERGLLEPGSDLGAAIDAAAKLLEGGDAESKVMLIVSDGEDHGAAIAPAVSAARSRGIRIYTAGAGSVEGAPVLDPDPVTGELVPRIGADAGPILTRLDETAMRLIARDGAGRYVALAGDGHPLTALTSDFDALADSVFGRREATTPIERFQLFAAVALLLADLELLLAMAGRRRSGSAAAAKIGLVAGPAIFIAALCGTSVADINDDANDAYDRGDYAAALDLYHTAQTGDDRPELSYNVGNTLDQLTMYEEAIAETLKACDTAGLGCAAPGCDPATPGATASPAACSLYDCDPAGEPSPDVRAECALANSVNYALGNHYAGAARLREALDAYRRALLADATDGDARFNYEVVTRRLTPSPSPTPTPGGAMPLVTATPGDTGAAGGEGEEGGTSTPADPGQPGTPDPDGDPNAPPNLSREELERALEEALAGEDREFTEEEALRILDLLNEENRRSIEDTTSDISRPGPPDY